METNKKVIAIAVAISLSLTIGYNLLLPVKVKEVINTVTERVVGSAGNEYGEYVRFNSGYGSDEGTFKGGSLINGDGLVFASGTTTQSIRCPQATSTIAALVVNVTKNATSTTRVMYVGTSTNPFATSTTAIIAQRDVAANENFIWAATTTQGIAGTNAGQQQLMCRPGDYITASFKGGNHTWGVGTTTEMAGSIGVLLLGGGN